MPLHARLLWLHQRLGDKNLHTPVTDGCSADPIQDQKTTLPKDSKVWIRLFSQKQQQHGEKVPALSMIVKAGDEGICSSALFNSLHGHPGDLTLESVYDAFAHEVRTRPLSERSSYPSDISRFLSSKRPRRAVSRSDSRNGRTEVSPKAVRASLDLTEMGLRRSFSMSRKPTLPVSVNNTNFLVSERAIEGKGHGNWAQGLQNASNTDGRLSVAVSEMEIAALSVILGTRIQHGDEDIQSSPFKKGAYGISMRSTKTTKGHYTISLTQHKRNITQLPARGSSYSTLYAKHFASGSIPFSFTPISTNAILVTAETLQAVQSDVHLKLETTDATTSESKFLARLPHSRQPNFHNLVPTQEATSVNTLLDAIAALPFNGGLPPLATPALIQTIKFITTGGLVPGRLLQRLEALVDKIHRHSPQLQMFGPLLADHNAGLLFRERERLRSIASGAKNDEILADKVARMHRYITLLERLIYLIPDMKPHQSLAAVRSATQKEIKRCYQDAVTAFANKDTEVDSQDSNRNYNKRASSASESYRRPKQDEAKQARRCSSQSASPTSTLNTARSRRSRFSSTFPAYNLGSQIEKVLKGSIPFDVETVALVARLIIVAWTQSVGEVGEGDGAFQLPDMEGLGKGMVVLC